MVISSYFYTIHLALILSEICFYTFFVPLSLLEQHSFVLKWSVWGRQIRSLPLRTNPVCLFLPSSSAQGELTGQNHMKCAAWSDVYCLGDRNLGLCLYRFFYCLSELKRFSWMWSGPVYICHSLYILWSLFIYDGLILFLISYAFGEGWWEDSGRMGCYMVGWRRGGGLD